MLHVTARRARQSDFSLSDRTGSSAETLTRDYENRTRTIRHVKRADSLLSLDTCPFYPLFILARCHCEKLSRIIQIDADISIYLLDL